MTTSIEQKRFYALDGFRGIAIILVILTHVSTLSFREHIPAFILQMITGSGVTGVCILFILSGFFMATLYPAPKNAVEFIQKRYTRIFPLFLVMCSVMFILREVPSLSWYLQILLVISSAILGNLVWVHGVRRLIRPGARKWMFYAFLFLQVAIGLLYVGWIGRKPPNIFNQYWPPVAREATIYLTNATLTLPLGDYIPMLDGVYWSLVAEVLFYILYPLLCVPIITRLIPAKRNIKVAFLVFLIPFFVGLTLIFNHILVFSMLQIYLFSYFCSGIVAGYLYKHHRNVVIEMKKRYISPLKSLGVVMFFTLLLGKVITLNYVSLALNPLAHIIWSIPLTILVVAAIDDESETSISKVLRKKYLVFLGAISYSMYLTHTLVVHFVEHLISPSTLLSNGLSTVATLSLTILLSYITYVLVEMPYFSGEKQNKPSRSFSIPLLFSLTSITLLYLLFIFIGFQSKFNFFSQIEPVPVSEDNSPFSLLDTTPKTITFTSTDDTLQILTIHLVHKKNFAVTQSGEQTLQFRIKELGNQEWFATSNYRLAEIGDVPEHLLAFPLLTNTKGKQYMISFQLLESKSSEYLEIDPSTLRGVYSVDKRAMTRHPVTLFQFIFNKMRSIVFQPQAQVSIATGVPLLIFLWALQYKRKQR